MPLDEQETTINFCRTEDTAEVWTSDRTVMTKLDRMCREHPENYRCSEVGQDAEGVMCKTYVIADKSLLSFRGNKVTRELTEEQRKAAAERLKALRMPKTDE